MAGEQLYTLSQMLKDYYLEDTLVFEIVREWTCPNHERPVPDAYAYVCAFDSECGDPDCPHTEYVKIHDGPECCKKAEWVNTLDENGEEMFQARMSKGVRGMMEEPFLLGFLTGKETDE